MKNVTGIKPILAVITTEDNKDKDGEKGDLTLGIPRKSKDFCQKDSNNDDDSANSSGAGSVTT